MHPLVVIMAKMNRAWGIGCGGFSVFYFLQGELALGWKGLLIGTVSVAVANLLEGRRVDRGGKTVIDER